MDLNNANDMTLKEKLSRIRHPKMEPSDKYVGRVILGQYRIIRKLGSGGMGSVYLAEQPSMSRVAAIKILLPQFAGDKDLITRFKREAQTIGRLSHPNIITVFNFGQLDVDTFYLAMEYVEGVELGSLMNECPLPVIRAVDIMLQSADALYLAHSHNVVHRDLKPANILVMSQPGDDRVKILDFGIAGVTDDAFKTQTGVMYGTPKFMSPEQVRGEQLDGRSDQYSLGLIFYRMLSGEDAITADSSIGYVHAHQETVPINLRKRRPDLHIPESVDRCVMRMLEKDPAKRFPDMLMLKEELLKFKKEQEEGLEPKKKSHNRFLIFILLALLAAMAVSVAVLPDYLKGMMNRSLKPSVHEPTKNPDDGKLVVLETSQPWYPAWMDRLPASDENNIFVLGRTYHAVSLEEGFAVTDRDAYIDLIRKVGDSIDEPWFEQFVRPGIEDAIFEWGEKDDPATVTLDDDTAQSKEKARHAKRLRFMNYLESEINPRFQKNSFYWEKLRHKINGKTDTYYEIYSLYTLPKSTLKHAVAYYTDTMIAADFGIFTVRLFPTVAFNLDLETKGYLIVEVVSNSPAFHHGFRRGDIITHMDGKTFSTPEELKQSLSEVSAALTQEIPQSNAIDKDKEIKTFEFRIIRSSSPASIVVKKLSQ